MSHVSQWYHELLLLLLPPGGRSWVLSAGSSFTTDAGGPATGLPLTVGSEDAGSAATNTSLTAYQLQHAHYECNHQFNYPLFTYELSIPPTVG